MWSPLTSGMTSGTSDCMRSALELETTAQPGVGKLRLQFAGDRGIERGENNLGSAVGLGGRDGHIGDEGGDGGLQSPARRFRIGPALGAIGGGKPGDLEPRMVFQHLDKTLPDDAGGTENSYR